jgi:putative Ca2+/H+ antiporter (TMEM165/GDT1 family)
LVFIGFAVWTLRGEANDQDVVTRLGKRLPERFVRYAAATTFAIVGAWLLVDALAALPS